MRSSRPATRRGVKARLTTPRRRVCSGGSCMSIVIFMRRMNRWASAGFCP